MRFKVVPPVRSVAFLREASDCLPLVPGTVEDCCTRIRDGTDLQSRDAAREYLTFCRALGLARESEGGYFRPPEPPADGDVAAAFLGRVYGASEIVDALDQPASAAATFDEVVEPLVPRWERDRAADWPSEWRAWTERVLGWGVECGVVERVDRDRYRAPD